MPTGNQLALEKSPYLQQHASNPVDWLPWGEDAFELARKTDRPVFLSIGYSTCHWCHVMERESFEDEETARALNEAFVCIKVDREERPDIDGVYMTACQMMTGSGGWPLTVLVTPDKEPFFAATYLPPKSLTGRIGVRELAAQVKELWKNRRGEILEAAANMAGQIRSLESPSPGQGDTVLSLDTLERGYHELLSRFDEKNAGFGSAPKFPTPHILLFLLRRYRETNDHKALEMATRTLRAMRLGGIWDHVGFGIHRYSTDAVWLLPHFEKMLYDQALTALACLECFQTTGDDWYASMALEIFDYVLRDMTTAEGGFASAEDADSEGEEGRFYVWTAEEIRAILGKEDGDLFMSLFSCHEEGNFLEEATGHPTGTNIPHLETPLAVHAQSLSISPEALTAKAEKMRARLFKARDLRTRPLRDDKILADWNGLMITALARGARVLGEKRLEYAAADAADFILREMRQEDGRLLHRWRDNEAAHPGTLQDHACMLLGLLELHQAEPVTGRIGQAEELARVLLNHFRGEGGGFLLMPQDADSPLVRQTDILDGATPSGNALTMLSLIIFSRLARDPELAVAAREAALGVPDRAASMLRSQPGGLPGLLLAIEQTLAATRVLTVEGPAGNDAVMDMIQELGRRASSCDLVDFKESPENPVIRVCLRGACLPAVDSVGEALSTGL